MFIKWIEQINQVNPSNPYVCSVQGGLAQTFSGDAQWRAKPSWQKVQTSDYGAKSIIQDFNKKSFLQTAKADNDSLPGISKAQLFYKPEGFLVKQ